MKTKKWLILLASSLLLAAAPLTGCSDDGDPSSNNGGTNNGGGVDVGPSPDTNVGQDTGGTDTGGGDDTGGSATCTPNSNFTGQAYTGGEDPDAHAGGNPVDASTVTLDSAGLQTVVDAVDALVDPPRDEFDTDDVDESLVELDTPLDVSGALVIATGRSDNPDTADTIEGNDWLYLQDGDTSLVLNGGFVGSAYVDAEPAEAVKVGDTVSFTVTQVRNVTGNPEAARVTGFSVDSSDNDVPFTDLTGQDVTMDYWGQLVRVSGQLTADNGSCGGQAVCYELSHGDPAKTVVFRSSSNFVEPGTCVTFFGPLGSYPGPLGDSPSPQLNEVNWDWTFTIDPVAN